jgi:hypothetical protein
MPKYIFTSRNRHKILSKKLRPHFRRERYEHRETGRDMLQNGYLNLLLYRNIPHHLFLQKRHFHFVSMLAFRDGHDDVLHDLTHGSQTLDAPSILNSWP